jgi:signal peptidase I
MRQLRFLGESLWQRPLFRVFLAVLAAAFVGITVAHAFIGSVSMVSGTSMLPTYEPGTWVYAAPISTPLERGDIVVLDDGNKECAVKRIVGLPGELVHIKHGYVFINRKMLIEPYLPKKVYTFPTRLAGVFVLGQDQYFVLGDNRPGSSDSRNYGAIDRKQIKRRIPLPEGAVRAHFSPHLLPAYEAILPPRPVQKLES